MKGFYKSFNILFVVFFIAGILFTAYELYNMPNYFAEQLSFEQVGLITPLIHRLSLIVGLTILVGFLSNTITLYLLNFTKINEKVIYVEKTEKEKAEDEEKKKRRAEVEIDQKAYNKIINSLPESSDRKTLFDKMVGSICKELDASQGIFYVVKKTNNKRLIELFTSYAFSIADSDILQYEFGEGLAGQAAKENKKMLIDDVPDGYLKIFSGLGSSSPTHLSIMPVELDGEVFGVLEIASFKKFSEADLKLIENVVKASEERLSKENEKTTTKKNKSDSNKS